MKIYFTPKGEMRFPIVINFDNVTAVGVEFENDKYYLRFYYAVTPGATTAIQYNSKEEAERVLQIIYGSKNSIFI